MGTYNNYDDRSGFYGQDGVQYGFDGSNNQFGQDLNFQSFSNEQVNDTYGGPGDMMYTSNPYLNPGSSAMGYQGSIFTPSSIDNADTSAGGMGGGEFEDEPPLLEELGINPRHIMQKTLAVLNPFRSTEPDVVQDTDLAGPLAFCLAFGGLLMLSGKLHFNYIYGIGVLGCLGMFVLLSLMSSTAVTVGVVISVLGYCLLPMVALSGLNIVFSLQGILGMTLTGLAILWCSFSASKLFVTALAMDQQQMLVAYPCALLYGVFALITVF